MRRVSGMMSKWWQWALGLALVAAFLGPRSLSAALTLADDAGFWAPLLYGAVYAVSSILGIPGAPLTIAGGFLFGAWWGSLYAAVASTVGACLAFALGTRLAEGPLAPLADLPAFRSLKKAADADAARLIFLARLAPGFPFNPAVYAFAVAGVRPVTFVAATALGSPPCAAFFAIIGHAAAALGVGAFGSGWTAFGAVLVFAATAAAALYAHGLFARALDGERGPAWAGLRMARSAGRVAAEAARGALARPYN